MTGRAQKRVCLGAFAGAHGVKGDVKIKAFTQKPEAIAAYGPVETECGARFTLSVIRVLKDDQVLARAPEIKSREDTIALKGERFYVDRQALPPPDEDEFYLDDLVGLIAFDETGAPMGAVKAVYNFGAGDVIELMDIPGIDGPRLVAFTKESVPGVDLDAGRITVRRDAVDIAEEESTADETANAAAMGEEDA